MTDYSELVKALRWCANDEPCTEKVNCGYWDKGLFCMEDFLMHDAANAIEELQQIVDHYEQTAKDYWKEACEYKAQIPHWVSVEDELPPPNKTVLVCKIWSDVNGEPHKVITMDSFTISPSDSVIAWMPLPQPPQEVQDGSSR